MKGFAAEIEKIAKAGAPSPEFLRALAQQQDEEEAKELLRSQKPGIGVKAFAGGAALGAAYPMYQAVGVPLADRQARLKDVQNHLNQVYMEEYVRIRRPTLPEGELQHVAKQVLEHGFKRRSSEIADDTLAFIRYAGGMNPKTWMQAAEQEGPDAAMALGRAQGGLDYRAPVTNHQWLPEERQMTRALREGYDSLLASGKIGKDIISRTYLRQAADRGIRALPTIALPALAGGLTAYGIHRANRRKGKALMRRVRES